MNFRYFGLMLLLSGAPLFGAQAETKRSAAEQEKLDRELFYGIISGKSPEEIEKLLQQGADPNFSNRGNTLLMNVSWPSQISNRGQRDKIKIIEVLIKYGAKVNQQDAAGNTALLQVDPQSPGAVQSLLNAGANPTIRNRSGDTVFMTVAASGGAFFQYQAIKAESLALLTQSLKERDRKSIINAQNDFKRTALMKAAESGCRLCIPILIEAGADPFIEDDQGKTAFDYAETPEMKKILSDYMQTYRKTITESVHVATPLTRDVSGVVAEYLVGPIQPKKAEPKEAVPARKQEQGKAVSEEEDMPEVD